MAIFGLAASTARALLFRTNRSGVYRGRPRRFSGSARDEPDLHLFTRRRNAARTYDDAVGVNLCAEAAVSQAIAQVLGALQVEVGRTLFLAAVTVDHELGARIGLHCGNHAILQD